jgi:hypothetical protein
MIVGIITVLVIATAASLFLVRAAEDKVTDNLVSRVDRFNIPADWTQDSNIVRPERFLCLDTNPCPSIYRRWNTGKKLTLDDLKAVSSSAGLDMKTEGSCQRQPNDNSAGTVCSSSGTDGDYDYIVNVISTDQNEPDLFVLAVRPHE